VIDQPHPWVSWTYGSGEVYGDPALTYGSTATPEEVNLFRSLIKKWKPAHAVLMQIILVIGGAFYGQGNKNYGDAGFVYGSQIAYWGV
jgi:hypothetical protein